MHQLISVLWHLRHLHHQPRPGQNIQHQPQQLFVYRWLIHQSLQVVRQLRLRLKRSRPLLVSQQIQHQLCQVLVLLGPALVHNIRQIFLHQQLLRRVLRVPPAQILLQGGNLLRLQLGADDLQLNGAHLLAARRQVCHHLLHHLRLRVIGSRSGEVREDGLGVCQVKVTQVVEPLFIENVVVNNPQVRQPVPLQQVVDIVFSQRQHYFHIGHR